MAPRGQKPETAQNSNNDSHDDLSASIKSLSAQVKSISDRMVTVDMLEDLISDLKSQNELLRKEISEKDRKIEDLGKSVTDLELKLNSLEQHHRGWSARVLNVPISSEEEKNPDAVIQKVYNLALLPILKGAHEAGELREIPSADQVLEVAHVLPGRAGQHKPIIMRFYNRNLRGLCFKHKRDYATRVTRQHRGGAGGGAEETGGARPGAFCFPLYEDLTRTTFHKYQSLSKDTRVTAIWTVNGQIKLKKEGSNEVIRVKSVFDTNDKILK